MSSTASPHKRSHRAPALRRRELLLRAAIEIIGEQGVGAVTHRGVAQRAGLAPSNTTYFFSSIEALIDEAFRDWASRRCAELSAFADRAWRDAPGPSDFIDAVVEAVIGAIDRPGELAAYEAYLHAARTAALRDAVSDAIRSFQRIANDALEAAGVSSPEVGARAFVAMIDGFIIQYLADPQPGTIEVLRQALRALFVGIAMGQQDLDRWSHPRDEQVEITSASATCVRAEPPPVYGEAVK